MIGDHADLGAFVASLHVENNITKQRLESSAIMPASSHRERYQLVLPSHNEREPPLDWSRGENHTQRPLPLCAQPKTFLISPIRGYPADAWKDVVLKLENQGDSVHWPSRDTDQSNL